MPNLAPQVDICDGQNVDSNNDEFQEYRHKSRENAALLARKWLGKRKRFPKVGAVGGKSKGKVKTALWAFSSFYAGFIHFWLQSLVGLIVRNTLKAVQKWNLTWIAQVR